MRYFLDGGRLLLLDLASTILFIAVFLLTHNTYLSVGLGMALGLTQIGTQFARRKPIETMEWLSLFLVIAAGAATLLTDDLRYVLFKPSVIYTIVGVVMLKPGWINRYLPAIAQAVVPIGPRSSGRSGRWLSICRHSTLKRRLKAMLQMTMIAAGPKARDSAVMSANRPR